MSRTKLPDHDEWLAAEYALGVLPLGVKQEAEKRYENETGFRAAVDGWHNQLEPMLEEIGEETPPPAVWKAVEKEIGISAEHAYANANAGNLWKWLTGASSAVAAASVAALLVVTDGDITGNSISQTRQQLAVSNERVATLSRELDAAQSTAAATSGELDAVRQQIASVIAEREGSLQQVAALEEQLAISRDNAAGLSQELALLEEQVNTAVPLVATLTQEGEAPAFVAQYDPLKRSLLIRTSTTDTDEKVPEVWFIPEVGEKKGEVLSLGVMNENAPDRLALGDEFIPWMGEGGTLAITMEPAGGSPTGVATGPIIAVGKLQALQ